MKSGDLWIAEYCESHQNPTNKLLHWLCVPAIMWTVLAFLWSIPVPSFMSIHPWVNWASIFMALAMFFYLSFGIKILLAMLIMAVGMLWFTEWLAVTITIPIWQVALVVFIVSWVGQFVGHHLEGKKPSFFKDLQFLLVGPAWEVNYFFRKIGFIK